MSDLCAWLSTCSPAPPMSLDPWLLGLDCDESGSPERALTEAAGAALESARRAPGRVRDSAFHLLAADALMTYACEAGLESSDPGAALERILAAGWLR